MFRKFAQQLFQSAEAQNHCNILELIDPVSGGKVLDLGCDNGEWTSRVGQKAGAALMSGVDIEMQPLVKARSKGVRGVNSDLSRVLPFADNTFVLVHSNQVIEHLPDVDNFVQEMFRVLRPGGWAIVSTENLSSWHNIAALILGRQAFSQHISARVHVGNEWALHAGEALRGSWTHMKVFSWYGFKGLFELYGFRVQAILGAGYHPLPARLAAFASRVDPLHAHFITLKAQKRYEDREPSSDSLG